VGPAPRDLISSERLFFSGRPRADRSSRTAQHNALFRASEQRLPRPLFVDPWARRFLRGRYRLAALLPAIRAALARGIDPLVLLGAGFDTRAHRLPGIERVRVIEVDHPATQAMKRRVVSSAPAHATYVPVDLTRDALYRYFAAKEDLIAAIPARHRAAELALLRDAAERDDVREALRELVRAFRDQLSDPRERVWRRVTVQLWAEALHSPRVMRVVREVLDEPLAVLAKLLHRVPGVARACHRATDGVALPGPGPAAGLGSRAGRRRLLARGRVSDRRRAHRIVLATADRRAGAALAAIR
jgi:AcrR family transcriptional regulator